MIRKLDIEDKYIVEKILDIQKASYLVEAEIIGFYDIPTLKDTIETIKESEETFYGYYIDNILAGIISYKYEEKILDIHRVAIHPNFFRMGIGKKLLNFIQDIQKDANKIIVTTGKQNMPAVNLYIKNGFKKVEDIEIKEGVYLTTFEKMKSNYSSIKENLKESYDNYAYEREKSEIQQWKIAPRQNFLELLNKENKKTLLEIGAGTGKDSIFFKNNGLEVVAVDLSSEMVNICKDKGLEAYELDFYNIGKLNKKFHSVWAMNCLLHVPKENLPKVLNEIEKILEPGGIFFMGVYGGEDSEGVWEEDVYNPPRFFSFYTDERIKEVVSKHFSIVSFERVETGEKFHFQSIILRKV
ncbi:GNAT family N-acetyltransferase [Clostridium sp. MSJ-11]|uniref:GNAT family N-acetyltransferase n=1 Tax=Clostridium mobile TaxID=2841512 RepID=A0ABS6EFI3_9CLOT|nr:bifunctional GNAT family N-acetyltransferase/class I SAM-dependent methyltransferase [Clostridium mobile]MBU5483793.1 GNAT family N-acetyltransferase [Clostridium mobile]